MEDRKRLLEEIDAQYKIAKSLIEEYHEGQVDIGGEPYINHLYAVFNMISDAGHNSGDEIRYAKAGIVALLHDILEDTDCTEQVLIESGIHADIIDAVKVLTRDPSKDYFDYICSVREHPVAFIVKIYDLEHNMDVRRLKSMTDGDLRRIRKYWAAWKFIKGEINSKKHKT